MISNPVVTFKAQSVEIGVFHASRVFLEIPRSHRADCQVLAKPGRLVASLCGLLAIVLLVE